MLIDDSEQVGLIESLLLQLSDSEEYRSIKRLVECIPMLYLNYMSRLRLTHFAIPQYLMPLYSLVLRELEQSSIDIPILIKYLLDSDCGDWINYYVEVYICPIAGFPTPHIDNDTKLRILILMICGYIIDEFRDKTVNIDQLIKQEKLLHNPNAYGLSFVNEAEFHSDYFIIDDLAYMYNPLTPTQKINQFDSTPGFVSIILSAKAKGDFMMRVDDALALPADQAISYSTINAERYYGPQFHFKNTILQEKKTLIVHIDPDTQNKLLMVIKKDTQSDGREILHVEVETLPFVPENSTNSFMITTFIHGIYHPDDDYFEHIDLAKNQYDKEMYIKKYRGCDSTVPANQYTVSKDLHYKIWCIEGGRYSKEMWYQLIQISTTECYCKLLDEIII